MLSLDEILDKTIVKNITEEEIIEQTKIFHNKIFDEKNQKELKKPREIINNFNLLQNYKLLRNGMMIGYMKKNNKEKSFFCEGRILNIFFKNKKLDYIEIYNFVLNKKENINDKEYNLFIFNKFTKENNELQNYSYVENLIILDEGQIIKYIPKKRRNKVSCGGKIEKIFYNKEKTNIDKLELYNFMTNRKWKIKVEKYYLFVYDSIEKQINIINNETKNMLKLIENKN